jgi:hypothetical protein
MSERQIYESEEQTNRLLKELVEETRRNGRKLDEIIKVLGETESVPATGFTISQIS